MESRNLRKVFDLLLEKRHLCLCLSDNSSLLHGSSRLFPLDWTCVIAFLGSGQIQALHLLLETVTYFVVQIVFSWFCPPKFLVDVSSIAFKEHRYPSPSWTAAFWNLSADKLSLSLRCCFTVSCFLCLL